MGLGPDTEGFDGGSQGAARPGQLVIHARRDRGKDRPGQEPVALQPPQRERQHALRDAPDHPLDLVESLRPITQKHDDEHAPFVTNARQYSTDGAAIARPVIRNGHFDVLWYQNCAFLRDSIAVTNIALVLFLYQGKDGYYEATADRHQHFGRKFCILRRIAKCVRLHRRN